VSDCVSSSITQAAGGKKFCACKTKDLGNELVLAAIFAAAAQLISMD